jgi:plastocyanin
VIRAAALLLGAGLLVGCTPSAAPSPVATDQVALPRSYRFEPTVIAVPVGTTVTWTNNDQFTHSVRLSGEPNLVLRPGDDARFTFGVLGTYEYDCSFHAQAMRGTVIVEAHE